MTQRLKRWESPRRQGRNDKGKGGSARQRQLKKQQQMLRKKLKEGRKADNPNHQGGREPSSLPFFGRNRNLGYAQHYQIITKQVIRNSSIEDYKPLMRNEERVRIKNVSS